jgi:aminopeptidase 2
MSLLGRIVSVTTEEFGSDALYKEVESFFGSKELPAISRSIQQSLERIKANMQWLERDRARVAEWVKSTVV